MLIVRWIIFLCSLHCQNFHQLYISVYGTGLGWVYLGWNIEQLPLLFRSYNTGKGFCIHSHQTSNGLHPLKRPVSFCLTSTVLFFSLNPFSLVSECMLSTKVYLWIINTSLAYLDNRLSPHPQHCPFGQIQLQGNNISNQTDSKD